MVQKVAQRLGVMAQDIEGREQLPHLTNVRYVYWKLLKDVCGLSIQQIRRVTGRSRGYIYQGIKHIEDGLDMDDAQIVELWGKVSDIAEKMEMYALHLKVKNRNL